VTLFLNAHTGRLAPGSFQRPAPIPASAPGSPDFVTVCFNKDWLPYVLGSLFQLTLNTTWQAANDAELRNALQMANDLILIFQLAKPGCQDANPGFAGAGDDYMLRQNPDNPCELQSSVDGVTWCTWADLSKCSPQAQQPGSEARNPGSGGCELQIGSVMFGSRWLLPFPVNTGDVITVTNAVGTWASAGDLFIPRCPDGNIFFNVSGIPELDACVDGTGHTEPGDPAPTINHDSLIAFDGTNYYDCGAASSGSPVAITIPAGITNGNLFFMANTPDTIGFGSVTFDVQYCNNAVPSWTVTFDFRSNKFGFEPFVFTVSSEVAAAWAPSLGWQQVNVSAGTGPDLRFTEDHIFRSWGTPATITQITMEYNATLGSDAGGSTLSTSIHTALSGTDTPLRVVSTTTGSNQTLVFSGSQSADRLDLSIETSDAGAGATGDGLSQILSVTISGTGPNPFA
jgi:hypothetical protein